MDLHSSPYHLLKKKEIRYLGTKSTEEEEEQTVGFLVPRISYI